MPGRVIPLANDQTYHIFNRGVGEQHVFLNARDFNRALHTIIYYRNQNTPLRYSYFIRLPSENRKFVEKQFQTTNKFLIDIYAYCLMPNHFHLLIRQLKNDGISTFMANFSNSYTKYFNTKNKRLGHLFQGKFKAVRVENDEQFLHLSRYIHLNPYSSYMVKSPELLGSYKYSSFLEYIRKNQEGICNKDKILSSFKTNKRYKEFVLDYADYQKRLNLIRHLMIKG